MTEAEIVYTVWDLSGVIFNIEVMFLTGSSSKEQGAGRPEKEL